MVELMVRHTVADYGKWRPYFDGDDQRRKDCGATGTKQVYRDQEDPNTITLIMEWDTAENARKFTQDPALAAVMQQAGVVGRPALISIVTRS
jgi:hypothetical protein